MTNLSRLVPLATVALLSFCGGCERPPVPASTQVTGPPVPVIVNPKSAEGKLLLAERKKFHDTFVPEKTELPPAKSEKPATPAPDMQPKTPEPVPQAAPMEPAPGTQPQPMEPAPAPQPASEPPETAPAAAGTSPPPGAVDSAPPGGGQQISAEDAARRKGKEFGSGPIATPIGAYFSAKERIKLIQFESELGAWVTRHDRKPRDFLELNEHVLKPAGIVLPQLREGERYIFDPKQGQYGTLLVEQPAPK